MINNPLIYTDSTGNMHGMGGKSGSAGGNYREFATDSVDDVNNMVKEGFKYSNAQFLPNNQPNSYKVIMDLGKSIGTKGETKIQVIVGADGKIWTSYPIK